MVIPLQKCCCLPVRPGCVLIGIMYGIENLGAFVTIMLMINGTDFEHPKNADSKALHVSLLFLAVISLAMFFSDMFLIVGTVMKWKTVLYSWVVVYTALICTKTLTFIITAIMCILATNCRLTIGILTFIVAYIPMAIYCYCVIVVYSYFIIVTQGSGCRSIMPADGSEDVENFCYCVGIAVRYQITEDEIPDEIEHKVMSAFLIYLIVLSGTMFLFNIFFIIGTLFDWKHVIFGWVVVYSMLLGMRSVMFLATAVLCIMIPTCNSILGVIIFSAAYIPMAFHSFFVMVVHGYFRYLQPRETPVFIVSKRGGSFQKESPRRIVSRPKVASIVSPKEATNKPNPRQATNQPNPKEPSNKPNPEEATNKSNPKEATNKPNPKELPNRSNPKQPPNRTNPKEPSYRPIPEEWASHLLCYCKRELRNK